MLNVVIPESIPSLNKGEMAILEGIKEALSLFEKSTITIYSPWPEVDRQRYSEGIKVASGYDFFKMLDGFSENPRPFSRFDYIFRWSKLISFAVVSRLSPALARIIFRDELLQALTCADLIIIGHDGCFSCELFWFVLAGKIMYKPVAIYGVGKEGYANDVLTGFNKFIVRYAFKHTLINVIRDSGTLHFLLNNGVSQDLLRLSPDPAVLMKPCSDERTIEILKTENVPLFSNSPLFGLIPVRGGVVYGASFENEKNKLKKHELRVKFWIELLEHLIKNTNAHFVFLPHCIGPVELNDDRKVAKEIAEGLPAYADRITLITNEYSAVEFKGLMKQCAYVLSERTHALIGAISVATPCMALTVREDRRMHNIINTMFGRPTFDLNDPDIGSLKKLLLEEWENRDTIKTAMETAAKKVINEAMKSAEVLKEKYNAFYS